MRAPIYWQCGGDVFACGRPISDGDALALMAWRLDEVATATAAGRRHAAQTQARLAIELNEALTAAERWRRVARLG